MLVLTRRVGETILIGEDVKITVVGFQSRQVRIGVRAQKEVEVHRIEVFERIAAERRRKESLGALAQEAVETDVVD